MKTEKRVMAVLPVFLAVTLVSGGAGSGGGTGGSI